MITRSILDFSTFTNLQSPQHLGWLSKIIVGSLRILKVNSTAYKLDYFEKMLNYLRAIGCYVLVKNPDVQSVDLSFTKPGLSSQSERLYRSLAEFMIHFEILEVAGSKIRVNKSFKSLLNEDLLEDLVKRNKSVSIDSMGRKERNLVYDFHFVHDLVMKYRDTDYSLTYIKGKRERVWISMIRDRKLDYEIRLSETLYHLVDLVIPQKIKSPFDEDYYTESGRNAFKNFTQFRFPEYLREVSGNRSKLSVFDLGCGYGNYIEVLHRNFPDAEIKGIEINPRVYATTHEKFRLVGNIEIINDDFFSYSAVKKVDFILMNYVLFYFNFEDKKRIIEKAKEMLTEGGSIILCQYISGIEALKQELARKQKDYSLAKKIEMYYSDIVLYANTLWNDAVDTFSEAVRWDEFKAIVSASGLHIASMTNADPFYYSLFIELKKD